MNRSSFGSQAPSVALRLAAVSICYPLFAPLPAAMACKYSVRDIGFARLQAPEEQVVLLLDRQRWSAVPGEWFAPELRAAGIETSILDLKDPDAARRWGQYRLPVAIAEPSSVAAWLLLESPTFPGLRLPLSAEELQDRLSFDRATRRLVQSPYREQLKRRLLEHHSVLLLMPGTDDEANRRGRQLVDRSAAAIAETLTLLPKPIALPPAVEVMTREQQQSEAVWLWSLGVDPDPRQVARIAVLYGRFRRMGEVMEVPGITQRELDTLVSLVGQDCECDLGRNWVDEPTGWHDWTAADDQRAYDLLGFDPGNPLVMAEMTRILARGPTASSSPSLAAPSDPLMGFEVISLEDAQPTESEPTRRRLPHRTANAHLTAAAPPDGPTSRAVEAVPDAAGVPVTADRLPQTDFAPAGDEGPSQTVWMGPVLMVTGGVAVAVCLATMALLWSARRSHS